MTKNQKDVTIIALETLIDSLGSGGFISRKQDGICDALFAKKDKAQHAKDIADAKKALKLIKSM